MLRVCRLVSFNSTIPRAQFFLILVTSASDLPVVYNSITFCCLKPNVEPCCHTHDSRTTVNVYSARHAHGRSRTVHSHGQP